MMSWQWRPGPRYVNNIMSSYSGNILLFTVDSIAINRMFFTYCYIFVCIHTQNHMYMCTAATFIADLDTQQ